MQLQLAARAIHFGQAHRMYAEESFNWRLRIGLALCLILGAEWGLLLGWLQIRVNAWLSPWLVVGVGMPLAFAGSMIVGLAFNRMLQGWPKLARLLMALFIVAGGIPFGLIWGLLELGFDPVQLANETGVGMWNLEWAMASVGLFGGMWPRWTIPTVRLFGALARWILSVPLAGIRWIGQKALDWLGWTGRFFQSAGRAILWVPTQIYRLMTRTSHNIGTIREQWLLPPDTVTSRHTRRPSQRQARTPKPKPTPAAANSTGSHNDAPRVTGVVEDRCPYCLDIVKRNDPRGVRICQVCGAPHHRDCWAITGKCQIPHPNT